MRNKHHGRLQENSQKPIDAVGTIKPGATF
jgi:hypothetical protein